MLFDIRPRRATLLAFAMLNLSGCWLAHGASSDQKELRRQASDASVTLLTTSAPSTTTPVSTAVPSPTASLNDTVPQQAPIAPKQAWCPSDIFCNGALLQTINVAQIFPDSKTFVDKPTLNSPNQTLNDFYAFFGANGTSNGTSATYGQVVNFVEQDFKGEGLELEALYFAQYSTPALLSNTSRIISDPILRGWASIVHSYWALLVRTTNTSTLCDGVQCQSTLIPLNHTFVVPGGRFREQYYWDSYWILEGLIQSEYYSLANDTLQNFMDELDTIGFIPNGGRIYYLDRSQPPLFMQMLWTYVNATNDTTILDRALPLAEMELAWWHTNRTVNVTSAYTNQTYEVFRYAVNNSAPRPEGFLEDYETANGPGANFTTEQQKYDLYAELATGAESGWDYSARWVKDPFASNGNVSDTNAILRTLNIRSLIPVDLNSILYKYNVLLADLYDLAASSPSNGTQHNTTVPLNTTAPLNSSSPGILRSRASEHRTRASTLRTAILDLHWSPQQLAFYDYNLTSSARNTDVFSAAAFYPYWSGVYPDELLAIPTNNTRVNTDVAQRAVGSVVRMVLSRYNGTFPATFYANTALQWDFPNAWPPHQFIVLQALRNLPSNVTSTPLLSLGNGTSTTSNSSTTATSFSLIPPGQLGSYFANETALPAQPLEAGGFAPSVGDVNSIESLNGEGWSQTLQRELAQRYIDSAFCSWYATGGSIPNLLPPVNVTSPNATVIANLTTSDTGHMYEKFTTLDVDAAGSGGEYQVVIGFGWTNGVVLWTLKHYGDQLTMPNCPGFNVTESGSGLNGTVGSTLYNVRGVPRLNRKAQRMDILQDRREQARTKDRNPRWRKSLSSTLWHDW